jgi:hypothetical protein
MPKIELLTQFRQSGDLNLLWQFAEDLRNRREYHYNTQGMLIAETIGVLLLLSHGTRYEDALRRVHEFAIDDNRQCIFARVDKGRFCLELAIRVRKPKFIDQGQMNLCGASSMLVKFAKDHPEMYATLAISLVTTGQGTLGNMRVAATHRIVAGISALPDPDYVTLASVRNSDAILVDWDALQKIGALTKPGVLARWMEETGYEDVKDYTFVPVPFTLRVANAITAGPLHGYQAYAPNLESLARAAQALALGRVVIMLSALDVVERLKVHEINRNIPGAPRLQPRNHAFTAADTHWTWVKRLTLSNDRQMITEIKLYSWARTYQARDVPVAAFMTYFAGFVSGIP